MMTDPAASRPGTHLDPDQLADLVEGLLDPAAADLARTHLASCPLCSADFALIAGEDAGDRYGAGLGDLLPPTPIPQDVVTRIEAALHREPPLGTGQPLAGHATARPRRRRFRLALGSLAGATLVVAGGIGVFTAMNGGGGSAKSNSASNAAPNAVTPNSQTGDSGSRVAGGPQESPALGAPDTTSAGGSFGNLSIEKQAAGLLGQHAESPASGTAQAGKVQCTPDTVPTGQKPITSAQTVYQGRQAWLFLYAEPGSPKIVDVYVVDRDSCGSDNLGHVAYQTTITRP